MIGEVGSDHEQSPLGKIKNAQDAEDEAHARGDEKVTRGACETVQEKMDKNTGFQEFLSQMNG